MSEVTFAKTFLTQLDKKSIKLPSDYVGDPRKYPSQSPFVLPKQSHPFPKRKREDEGGAPEKTITATLKPMRGGESVTLADLTLETSIHDLKTQYAQQIGLQQDKIKLLLNKKPAADLKTLKELGVTSDFELSVMVMGGAGTPRSSTPAPAVDKTATDVTPALPDNMEIDSQTPAPASEKAQMEVDESASTANGAAAILQTEEFWSDLKGFLLQRLKDEEHSEKLTKVFREAASSV